MYVAFQFPLLRLGWRDRRQMDGHKYRSNIVSYGLRPLTNVDKKSALPQILELCAAEAVRPGSHINIQEPDFYEQLLGVDGKVLAAYEGDEMVGFSALGLEAFVHSFWYPYLESVAVEPSDVGVCIHFLVAPNHRGRGLGRILHRMCMQQAREHGLRYLVATVSPDNHPTLKIFEKSGFDELARAKVYRASVLRVLLGYDLAQHVHEK